jgi:DNA-3-methyladenine glycosylase I
MRLARLWRRTLVPPWIWWRPRVIAFDDVLLRRAGCFTSVAALSSGGAPRNAERVRGLPVIIGAGVRHADPVVEISESGVDRGPDGLDRCWWCLGDPLYLEYHDREWGRPLSDDSLLFEQLTLEGFQSGLSWLTILRKRDNFRRAFKSFDIEAVARFNSRSVERLLKDAGIVRHRGKIESTINNARRCLDLIDEFGSFARYVWSYETPIARARSTLNWPTLVDQGSSNEAVEMSKDLRRRGWSFVGPTTVYSFMEAAGLVNDHMTACHLRSIVEQERDLFQPPT